MRAVMYTRVSSDRSGAGRSVSEQEAECRRVCADKGWSVVRVLVDNDAGASRHSRKDRPAYSQLASLLQSGQADVLVTWEASRAQRDLRAYVQLRDLCNERGVLWSYSGRTFDLSRYDDRLATGLDALLAEREADVTRERVLRAMRARVDAGMPHGKLAYGYRRLVDSVTGNPIGRVPDESKAAVVRSVAADALKGEPMAVIARKLNAQGIAAPRPGKNGLSVKWTPIQVRRMLINPTYAALRTHHGKVTGSATWEPLLSISDHNALVTMLTHPSRLTHKSNEIRHLLSGLAVCGLCGASMRRVVNRSTPSYDCSDKHHVTRSQAYIDPYVESVIVDRLSMLDALNIFADNDDLAALSLERLAELRRTLDSYITQAQAGEVSAESFVKIEKGLLSKIDIVQAELRSHARHPLLAQMSGSDAQTHWNAASIASRREVIRNLGEVIIDPAGRGKRTFDSSTVRFRWH